MSVRNAVRSIQDIMRQDTGVDGDAQRISQLCWMFFLKIIDDQDQELELLDSKDTSPIPENFRWRAWAANPEGITGEALQVFVNDMLFPSLKELQVPVGDGRRRIVRDVFEDAYNYMKSGQLMRQVINKINQVDFNDLAERQHFGEIYEQILNDLQSAGNAGEYYTPRAVTAFMAERLDPKPGEVLFDPACGTGGFLTCSIRHMRKHYVKTVKDEKRMQEGVRAVEKKQLPHMLCVTNMLLHGIKDPSFVRHTNTLARPYVSYGTKDRVDIVLTNPPFGGREEDGIESNFPKRFQTRETADLFLALIVRLLRQGGRAAVVLPDGTLFGEGIKTRLKEHLLEECNLHTVVRLPDSVFKPYATLGTNLLFFEKGAPTQEIWFYEHEVPDGQRAYSMTKPIRLEHFQECIDWWGGPGRKGRSETRSAWRVTIDDVKSRGYDLDIKNPNTVKAGHGNPEQLLRQLKIAESDSSALRSKLKNMLTEALAPLNSKSLLLHFDQLTAAVSSISLLRGFILDLAVRGSLVRQDATDEPASELLKRVLAAKSVTVNGRGGSGVSQTVTSAHAAPFGLPRGWEWAELGFLCSKTGSGSTPRGGKEVYKTKGVPFLRSQNIYDDGLRLTDVAYIDMGTHSKMQGTRVLAGDLLLNITGGSIGRCCIAPESLGDANVSQHVAIIRLAVDAMQPFVHQVILSPYFQSFITGQQTGAGRGGLPKNRMDRIPVAVAPLPEQQRIIATLSELMSVCDKLEEQIRMTEAGSRQSLEAVLHETLSKA